MRLKKGNHFIWRIREPYFEPLPAFFSGNAHTKQVAIFDLVFPILWDIDNQGVTIKRIGGGDVT